MSNPKINSLAEKLLDTGKRNNLINFKETKSSTVEVVIPMAEELFNRINYRLVTLEAVDTKVKDIDDTLDEEETSSSSQQLTLETAESGEEEDKRSQYINKHYKRIRKENQILLYNSVSEMNALTILGKIDKRGKSYIEDAGINVSYMCFGFVRWKEREDSSYEYKAPILLVPITMSRESSALPYKITANGDEVIVNPTFEYKLESEYGVKLPVYDNDVNDTLSVFLKKVSDIVTALGFTVEEGCYISNFSYMKINMYQDLMNHQDKILQNNNVRRILGEEIIEEGDSDTNQEPLDNPILELHNVVDADSSQVEAIEAAKEGKSFVLQGPPGTGKSQTITNIIAECLYDGKKVLFVSEKQAALNVVYNKLKNNDLADFCLELHSFKANKKDVLNELVRTLNAPVSYVTNDAKMEIEIKKENQKQLDNYAYELHRKREVIDASLYQLYESYSLYENEEEINFDVKDIDKKDRRYLTDVDSLLNQYSDFTSLIGYDYRENPWYGYTYQDNSYQAKNELRRVLEKSRNTLDELSQIYEDIEDDYSIPSLGAKDAQMLEEFFDTLSESKFLTPSVLDRKSIEGYKHDIEVLSDLSDSIKKKRDELFKVFDEDVLKLDGKEINRKLTRQFNSFFSRLFNSEYKKIISDMTLYKKDGKKISYKDAVIYSERLMSLEEDILQFSNSEIKVKDVLSDEYRGVETDFDELLKEIKNISSCYAKGLETAGLISSLSYSDFDESKEEFEKFASKLEDVIDELEDVKKAASYFDTSVFDIYKEKAHSSYEKCRSCLDDFDRLENWCRFRSLYARLKEYGIDSYVDICIEEQLPVTSYTNSFNRLFYYEWIDHIIVNTPVLSEFSRISQDRAKETFSEKDREQFDINKVMIKAKLSAQRPVYSADLTSSNSQVGILQREANKKRRQMSIRELLSKTGETIQVLKPCFLMSPLSVSTYLGDNVDFDVVIFDEASQIFPQDAMGAIYRAKQLIVVGDSKQMPPSNFFNSTADDPDDEYEEGSDDTADFESILDLCSAVFPQISLSWHYRSRFEQLIAFSNKNFYNSNLVSFPSPEADCEGKGVDYHYVEGGIFDRKKHRNRKEAEYVVDLIYDNIEKYPNRSLGVVAFSISQQDLIEKLLSKRRAQHPECEQFFSSEKEEPFFVKNLETVQGDERDTIIFSTAYGFDDQGRISLNFGPLNRQGGERRLNVAVTRAKWNVQLVTSMHATDIDLRRTSSKGVALVREYLDFAERGTIALDSALSVSSEDSYDSDFEKEVVSFLRDHGYDVDTQIGCSGYRIDMALKRRDSSDYVLAIECDGKTYHSSRNARDRDRLRQEILERMGWKFHRIWSTDWFRNRRQEENNLLEACENALSSKAGVLPVDIEEEEIETKSFELTRTRTIDVPEYVRMDDDALAKKYNFKIHAWYGGDDYGPTPKAITDMLYELLKNEGPLELNFFLKRLIRYFENRQVVTSTFRSNILWETRKYFGNYNIIRDSENFLMIQDQPIKFRKAGYRRDISQIHPQEIGEGFLLIIEQNVKIDKVSLYQDLVKLCGYQKLTDKTSAWFDKGLETIKDKIVIEEGDILSLK